MVEKTKELIVLMDEYVDMMKELSYYDSSDEESNDMLNKSLKLLNAMEDYSLEMACILERLETKIDKLLEKKES